VPTFSARFATNNYREDLASDSGVHPVAARAGRRQGHVSNAAPPRGGRARRDGLERAVWIKGSRVRQVCYSRMYAREGRSFSNHLPLPGDRAAQTALAVGSVVAPRALAAGNFPATVRRAYGPGVGSGCAGIWFSVARHGAPPGSTGPAGPGPALEAHPRADAVRIGHDARVNPRTESS